MSKHRAAGVLGDAGLDRDGAGASAGESAVGGGGSKVAGEGAGRAGDETSELSRRNCELLDNSAGEFSCVMVELLAVSVQKCGGRAQTI